MHVCQRCNFAQVHVCQKCNAGRILVSATLLTANCISTRQSCNLNSPHNPLQLVGSIHDPQSKSIRSGQQSSLIPRKCAILTSLQLNCCKFVPVGSDLQKWKESPKLTQIWGLLWQFFKCLLPSVARRTELWIPSVAWNSFIHSW